MKRAKKTRLTPRNPVALNPLLRKGGAHRRVDKRAIRARMKARQRREAGNLVEQ